MSTARAFASLFSLPVCPVAKQFSNYDTVGGLTLTQAMDFFWNLEDVQFTFAGSSNGPIPHAHTATINGTLKFKPPTATGDFTNPALWQFGPVAMLVGTGLTTFGSLPTQGKQPDQRVCAPVGLPASISVITDSQGVVGSDFYKFRQMEMYFGICIDPTNPAKFAIEYRFFLIAGDFNNYVVAFSNPLFGPFSSSGSNTTGTFLINGLTFNWTCWYNDNISGAAMSAATTKWTY